MNANAGLAAVATLMSTAFALSTWERYRVSGKIHHLAWTQSMVMFALASLSFWWACAAGWNEWNFRLFYLFGAILNVPYLAMGTVALLGNAGAALGRLRALHVVSAFCAGVVLAAPLHGQIPRTGLPSGRELFGLGPRLMAAIGSGLGATVLIAGALWSVVRLVGVARGGGQVGPVSAGRLVVTNTAIALGSLILGAGGGLSETDEQRGFALALAIGISVLFVGFLVSNPKSSSSSSSSAASRNEPFPAELVAIARGELP